MTPATRATLFAGLLCLVVAAAAVLPVTPWLLAGVDWLAGYRAGAWPLFVLAYVIATVLMLPGSPLTLAAGFIFGLPAGVAIVSLSSVLGACGAFLTGRYFVRDWVAERLAHLPRFAALDQAAARDGLLVVLLVRLSPLFPFNLTNYALGLTAVSFPRYLLGSWIGMLPGTIVYVYIGTLVLDLAALAEGGFGDIPASRYLLIGGFVATVLVSVVVARRARELLEQQLAKSVQHQAEAQTDER